MIGVRISELSAHVAENVELKGWLYNKRSSKKLHFLELRDGSGMVQCVVGKDDAPTAFETAGRLSQESSLVVRGLVTEHPKQPGVFELAVNDVEVLQLAEPYPLSPKEHGTDFLMDHRHLWLRSRRQHAILRVRQCIIAAVRDFFDARDFTLVDAPIFTPNMPVRGRAHFSRPTTTVSLRTSLSQDNCTWRQRQRPSARSTVSVQPFAPKKARRADTWPSSGWSNPKLPSWTSRATWTSLNSSCAASWRECSRNAAGTSKS
jgi:aspartyl/asparaginyl-tRNA synthetase